MKKKSLVLFSVVLALSVAFTLTYCDIGFCADPIIIKYADPSKAGTSRTKAVEETCKEIEKRTNGRVKHEFYWSESLVKAKDIFKGIQAGTCDVGDATAVVYQITRFPVWQFIQQLFIGGDDQYGVTKACNAMYEQNTYLKKEFDDQGVIFLTTSALTPTLINTKKELRDTKDFEGLRVRAVGPVAKWVASLGAAPNPLTFYEVTEALSRGVIDATQTYLYATHAYKFYEHCKFLPLNGVSHIFIDYFLSADTYKKMPADVQKIYIDTWRNFYVDQCVKYHDEERDAQIADFKKAGVTVYKLTPAELAKWKEAAAPVNETYYKAMQDKGIDGKKIVADYQALYDKFERKN